LVIKKVSANPKNINGRVDPIFPNNSGTTKIRRDENRRNTQKI
jgi:hypothetical protein